MSTPLRGDTIWGEMCWALRESRGEAQLAALLADARQTGTPPFLISDAFPAGWLPRPVSPPLIQEGASSSDIKKQKKVRLLPEQALRQNAANLSEKSVLACMADAQPPQLIESPRMHVSLNRVTGRAQDGLLFADNAMSRSDTNPSSDWDLFLCPQSVPAEDLVALLKLVGLSGHGADASTGMGGFTVEAAEPYAWPVPPDANAMLALGPFCPSKHDSTQGFWRLETRFGRVGNVYSSRLADVTPFKKPLSMLQPGSLLGLQNGRAWLGRIVPNVHKLEQVVHCAATPALPVRVTDSRWEASQ